MLRHTTAALAALLCTTAVAGAATLAGVGTYEGVAGIGTSNGDVTDSPMGNSYLYVTTAGSTYMGAGLGIGSETNGSVLTTLSFTAEAGDTLSYYFNYVTSDGTSSFIEYAYATLNDLSSAGANDKLIFTARTNPALDTVPGFNMPPLAPGVTLNPASSVVISGAPDWSQLGSSNNSCYSLQGCGYTGWIQSLYEITTPGTYSLTFGVVNWGDQAYDTGMAIAGLKINDEVIVDPNVPVVPLPAGGLLLASALAGLGFARRKKAA